VIRIRNDSTEGSSEFQKFRYPYLKPAANESSFFEIKASDCIEKQG